MTIETRMDILPSTRHCRGLLERLYKDALNGAASCDFTLQCPVVVVPAGAGAAGAVGRQQGGKNCNSNNPTKSKTKTFSFHLSIVASQSAYFSKFSTTTTTNNAKTEYFDRHFYNNHKKQIGLKEIDASTFEICIKFLYLGIVDDDITAQNVASVLNASNFLQISKLKEKCFEFLHQHLDESNYTTILELAETFENHQLVKKCRELKRLSPSEVSHKTKSDLKSKWLDATRNLQRVKDRIKSKEDELIALREDRRQYESKCAALHAQRLTTNGDLVDTRSGSCSEQDTMNKIRNYLHGDCKMKDFFTQLLVIKSDKTVNLGHLVLHYFQNEYGYIGVLTHPRSSQPMDARILWSKFSDAWKNYKKRRESSIRKSWCNHNENRMNALLEDFAGIGGDVDNYALRNALYSKNHDMVMQALFKGISLEGIELLKIWRFNYLESRHRQMMENELCQYPPHTGEGSCHVKLDSSEGRKIFVLPSFERLQSLARDKGQSMVY